jgi:hypothetical protein
MQFMVVKLDMTFLQLEYPLTTKSPLVAIGVSCRSSKLKLDDVFERKMISPLR